MCDSECSQRLHRHLFPSLSSFIASQPPRGFLPHYVSLQPCVAASRVASTISLFAAPRLSPTPASSANAHALTPRATISDDALAHHHPTSIIASTTFSPSADAIQRRSHDKAEDTRTRVDWILRQDEQGNLLRLSICCFRDCAVTSYVIRQRPIRHQTTRQTRHTISTRKIDHDFSTKNSHCMS